jgi:serine/threonine-protein kinase HipA
MKRSGLSVFADGVHAGTLSRSDLADDTFLFAYDVRCQDEHAVSLTMPVVADQYDSMSFLHPVFEMNLPEGALRHKLELMFSKAVRDFDALTLLEIVGRSQIGRLRYITEGASLQEVPGENIEKILAYDGAEALFDNLLERFAVYSGISGMQPKVLVRDAAPVLGRLTHQGATHIVKSFDPKETPELAANEFFSMRAARHAGLPTAEIRLSENRTILVVDRFDIAGDGRYLGFEDFCVLSGMRANGRYNGSYEALAEKVAVFVDPEHTPAAMWQLFGMVALACLIGNGDAHLKNFGVLYDAPGVNVRLAPVYDMLSTTLYQPKDVLALELDGSKCYPDRKQLIRFARHSCGFSNRRAEAVLAAVAQGVRVALEEMEQHARAQSDFAPCKDRLAKVFAQGLARYT